MKINLLVVSLALVHTDAQCSFARKLGGGGGGRGGSGGGGSGGGGSGGGSGPSGGGSGPSGGGSGGGDFPLSNNNIRSFDGSEHASAAAGATMVRISWPNYVDNMEEMDVNMPNPREISNALCPQTGLQSNTAGMSDMVWQFGQFLDHDIDLTHFGEEAGVANIPVSSGDLLAPEIPFQRSLYEPTTGKSNGIAREHINSITAFIDASNVYGSSQDEAFALRTFQEGRLRSSNDRKLLPLDDTDMFMAGDGKSFRANEQLGLTTMHTLFMREHNRLAKIIKDKYRDASDEQIYQLARKIVGAELQIITYQEFLPVLLGDEAPGLGPSSYGGFDPLVNPGISTEFSTASYRFGHTMLSPTLLLELPGPDGALPLRDAFFSPAHLLDDPNMVEQILFGLFQQPAQQIDAKIVDDVRDFLFANLGDGGLDLASLNIQRGRDHGLPLYNDLRVAYGLAPLVSFDQVTSDPVLAQKLESVYTSPSQIDGWVGGLAEDHLPTSNVGPLIAKVLRDQFERLRDGDPFFFLIDPDIQRLPRDIIDLDNFRLSDVIKRNTDISHSVPNDVFKVA